MSDPFKFTSDRAKHSAGMEFAAFTIKSLQKEAVNARSVFPTNENLLTSLVEFADEMNALMHERTNGKRVLENGIELQVTEKQKPSTIYLQSKALQVACLALRLFEEGDAAHGFNSPKKWVRK